LQAALDERDDKRLANALSILLAGMPSASQGAEDATNRVRAYRMALSDVPIWAVSEACKGIIAGRYPEHMRFCPSPAELARIARDLTAPIHAEMRKIDDVLSARVIEPPAARELPPNAITWAEVETVREAPKPDRSCWLTPDIVADLAARKAKREQGGAA